MGSSIISSSLYIGTLSLNNFIKSPLTPTSERSPLSSLTRYPCNNSHPAKITSRSQYLSKFVPNDSPTLYLSSYFITPKPTTVLQILLTFTQLVRGCGKL